MEMKNVSGGNFPPGGWCSTTFACANGTSATLTCENASAGCYGVDASSSNSGQGYGYCQENGVLKWGSCNQA